MKASSMIATAQHLMRHGNGCTEDGEDCAEMLNEARLAVRYVEKENQHMRFLLSVAQKFITDAQMLEAIRHTLYESL